jgi:hypothetical protein
MAIRLNARIHQLQLTLAEAHRRRLMRSQREQFRALVDSLPADLPRSGGKIFDRHSEHKGER